MRIYPDTVELVDTRRVRVTWSAFADTTAGYNENLLEYSEQFDDAAWPKDATITADTDVAPDGETTADRVADDNAASYESVYQFVTIPNDSNWVYAFVHVKKDSDVSRFPEVEFTLTAGAVGQYIYEQLNTLTGATTTRASAGVTSVNVTDLGTYWRLELGVKNNSTGNVNALLNVFPAMTTVWGNAEVTATGSIVMWGAQISLVSLRDYVQTLVVDGTYTYIRLAIGGLAPHAKSGKDAEIGGTDYPIHDCGDMWLRVLGNATGEGVPAAIIIEGSPQATAAYAVWAFVNGLPVAGCPVDSSDLLMEFNVPGTFFLEMHEEPLGVPVRASQEPHEQRPYLYWYYVASANKYLVYADPPVGTEFFMQWEWHIDGLNMFEAASVRDLGLGGAGWHWLRVEAKTAAGRASAGDPWPEYVYALPPEPTNASASGTSPNIAIDLTV